MKKRNIFFCTIALLFLLPLSAAFADGTEASSAAEILRNGNAENTYSAFTVLLKSTGILKESDPEPDYIKDSILDNHYLYKFSYNGIKHTENSYKSDRISIEIRNIVFQRSTCYVADIYVRDILNFQTAFSSGAFRGKRRKPLQTALDRNAILALTGDMYTMNAKGCIIRNGVLYEENRGLTQKMDLCVLYKDGTMCTYRKGEVSLETIPDRDQIWQLWVFGPVLLYDGEMTTDFNAKDSIADRNPRACIGYYEPGHYCFVAVDGRSKTSRGLDLNDLSAFMQEINCAEAYNLDGGASSAMIFNDDIYSEPAKGGRTMTDILLITEDTNLPAVEIRNDDV